MINERIEFGFCDRNLEFFFFDLSMGERDVLFLLEVVIGVFMVEGFVVWEFKRMNSVGGEGLL